MGEKRMKIFAAKIRRDAKGEKSDRGGDTPYRDILAPSVK